MSQSTSGLPTQPYGSARDVPSFRAIEEALQGATLLTRVIDRERHADMVKLKAEFDQLVTTVDRFYDAVGDRNWIFHDLLNPTAVRDLLDTAHSADEVEAGLIEMYRDPEQTKFWLLRLCNQPLLRERAHQIRRAYDHLMAEQFDSSTLQLIAVMDGYVSDLDAGNRQGLHAREPDTVVAWDSVVGHHLGLGHALTTFRKSINKRIDEPVFEVYRHGIVHGLVVNFDNPTVACKAWNMLFALNDWAVSLEKAARPVAPRPTVRELVASLARQGRYQRASTNFVASAIEADDPGFDEDEIVVAASAFLEAWQHGRWGIVASFMPGVLRPNYTEGQAASFTKECFERFNIMHFEVLECRQDQPSAAGIVANVTLEGIDELIRFRMAYWADDRIALPRDGDGHWGLAVWAPYQFFGTPADD